MNALELKTRLAAILARESSGDPAEPSNIQVALQFCVQNYDSMDEEARQYVEGIFERFVRTFSKQADALPNGPAKRRAIKAVEVFEQKRFSAAQLLLRLEEPPQSQSAVSRDARAVILHFAQSVLDLLHNVAKHAFEGPSRFAVLGLSYWAVEELLVALHLAQHAMTNQAYAHVRTIYEMLNKIELFNREPQWVDLWASGNEKKIWEELRPAAVRLKLEQPKFDPVYSFLSKMGGHSEFEGLQLRVGKMVGPETGKTARIKLWIGGNRFPHDVAWANISCVFAAVSVLASTMAIFAEFLPAEEHVEVRKEAGRIANEFFESHFAEWLKERGLPPDKAAEILRSSPWNSSIR
jgi:hypothetical protein